MTSLLHDGVKLCTGFCYAHCMESMGDQSRREFAEKVVGVALSSFLPIDVSDTIVSNSVPAQSAEDVESLKEIQRSCEEMVRVTVAMQTKDLAMLERAWHTFEKRGHLEGLGGIIKTLHNRGLLPQSRDAWNFSTGTHRFWGEVLERAIEQESVSRIEEDREVLKRDIIARIIGAVIETKVRRENASGGVS